MDVWVPDNDLSSNLKNILSTIELMGHHMGVADRLVLIKMYSERIKFYELDPVCKDREIHDCILEVMLSYLDIKWFEGKNYMHGGLMV